MGRVCLVLVVSLPSLPPSVLPTLVLPRMLSLSMVKVPTADDAPAKAGRCLVPSLLSCNAPLHGDFSNDILSQRCILSETWKKFLDALEAAPHWDNERVGMPLSFLLLAHPWGGSEEFFMVDLIGLYYNPNKPRSTLISI